MSRSARRSDALAFFFPPPLEAEAGVHALELTGVAVSTAAGLTAGEFLGEFLAFKKSAR